MVIKSGASAPPVHGNRTVLMSRKAAKPEEIGMTIRSAEEIANEHKKADEACGREWECACGACRRVRAWDEPIPAEVEYADSNYQGEHCHDETVLDQ